MAAAAACAGGCLSTDLREFLASDNKAQGTAGHQLLRKLLSICTGKCELSTCKPTSLPQAEGEELLCRQQPAHSLAATQHTLRPRRRLAQQPLTRPLSGPTRQQQQQQQQSDEAQSRQQQEPAHCVQQNDTAEAAHVANAALCSDLLDIVRRESGVVLALALHAMHIWAQGSAHRMQSCLRQGVVPVLLQVLVDVLSEGIASTPTAAYAASMAVILLRTLSRSSDEGMAAFVACGGVGRLLHLLPMLREDRALCLTLYLLSDVTRRSGEALAQAVGAEGVQLVVACLNHPLGESTKFAALLINRWCLLAPLGEQFRDAGALDSLLCVLRRQHSAMTEVPGVQQQQQHGGAARVLLSEVSAYSLSALSILGQDHPQRIRSLLVESPANLAAVTRAMTDYERSFQGTGFPHTLLSALLEGPEGSELVAQLLAVTELLPSWLSLRQVGWQLVDAAAQPGVIDALSRLPQDAQGKVAQSLTLLLPHSRAFLAPLTCRSRLEVLTSGAVAELLAATPASPFSTVQASSSLLSSAAVSAIPNTLNNVSSSPLAPCMKQVERLMPMSQDASFLSTKRESEDLRPSKAHCVTYTSALPGTSDAQENFTDRTHGPAGTARECSEEGAVLLQRDVSIIPESIVRLERKGHQQAQREAHRFAAECSESGSSSRQQAPAPFTAALRRLLTAWVLERTSRTGGAEESALRPLPGCKRAGEGRGGGGNLAVQQTKRARFAFSREDVNVRRYDTLTFLVGGREFHAVGFALEAHSPLLRSLLGTLSSIQETLTIPAVAGFDADRMYCLFGQAVEFCYTGGVEGLTPMEALDLWTLAEFLQIDGLQHECEAVLSSPSGNAMPAPPDGAVQLSKLQDSLLSARYELGLAYPSGSRLRLAVARELLERLAAQGPPPLQAEEEREGKENEGEGQTGANRVELDAELATLLAMHPADLAADLAQSLAEELRASVEFLC